VPVSGDPLRDLRDAVALQDEHSHVDVAVRRRIGEIILEIENEELVETARRLVEELPPEDVDQLVADWLDAQTAI
jgi:methyl coenzyme M reductase subunit D